MWKFFVTDDSGQGMVEYALILGFIALACVGLYGVVGKSVNNLVTEFANEIK